MQRIEQCGDRLVVTGGGIVHDMRCDGTEEHGVHDVAEFDRQTPITVVASYEDGVHVLRPVGFPIEVTRRREGPDMVWDYLGFTARLRRIGRRRRSPPERGPVTAAGRATRRARRSPYKPCVLAMISRWISEVPP